MAAAEATRRAARFEATLDPGTLWPDVDEAAFRAAQHELVRVTSAVLGAPDGRAAVVRVCVR